MIGTIYPQEGILKGRISDDVSLKGILKTGDSLIGKLLYPTGYDDYKGPYEVTPIFSDQVFETDDKHMTNDLIVKTIPYSEVSNESGGYTINIGG